MHSLLVHDCRPPRPPNIRTNNHDRKGNDVLHFDFIEIAPGRDDFKYIEMLRDVSRLLFIFPFTATIAETETNAILEWCATYNVLGILVFECGTHFKNETMQFLTCALRVPHHLALPHSP